MHAIRIDRGKRLRDDPLCGHNRYRPDIAPVVENAEGEEIALETRDALDGQGAWALDAGSSHPRHLAVVRAPLVGRLAIASLWKAMPPKRAKW
jgi:hypothetical protein